MAGDKDGKTEKPTSKRLKEARSEGRIARSPELVSWASIFIAFTLVQSTIVKGGRMSVEMMNDMGRLIERPDVDTAQHFMVKYMGEAMIVCAPLILAFAALAIIGHIAQVRFVVAFKSLKPQWKRMDPISGTKRLFSMQSMVMAGKQMLKTVVLGYIGYRTLWATMSGLTENGPYALPELIRVTCNATVDFVRQVAIAGVLISVFDYFYQRKKMGDQLKMTKQEIREESKSQDLSPEVRGKIRQRQRQMSRNRMMSAIKDADVVVVNPIHIAVALKYDPVKGAPRVVAKGSGFVAEKIRERAEENKVPMVQDIPLARTLNRLCDIDDEIPGELFEAVAKLLAFVFALRSRGTSFGMHRMPGSLDMEEADAAEARASAIADAAAVLSAP